MVLEKELKGIGGVITKPIVGVIDLVSKTSDRFKNTIRCLFSKS